MLESDIISGFWVTVMKEFAPANHTPYLTIFSSSQASLLQPVFPVP